MNYSADLFTRPKYRPKTASEFCEAVFTDTSYKTMQRLINGEYHHKASVFVPDEKTEAVISSIEYDFATWGRDYSKRRAIEQKTAAYIREKVVPSGLMGSAESIAERLEGCRQTGPLGLDMVSGRWRVRWDQKCGLVKLCPDEARAEQKRLSKRYAPAVEKWLNENRRRQFQYAVFEPVNVPFGELADNGPRFFSVPDPSYKSGYKRVKNPNFKPGGITKAFDELRQMLRHKSFKNVKGCFVAMECPMSRDGKSWNVHFNCMFLVDGHFDWRRVRQEYGQRIHFKSTREMIEATEGYLHRRAEKTGETVNLSRTQVLLAAFREIIKYSSKHVSEKSDGGKTDAPAITDWPAEAFVEWWTAHKGLRRCRSYGVLNGEKLKELTKHVKVEESDVHWIGSIEYHGAKTGYVMQINKRPAINSLQVDKSTRKQPQNRRQLPLTSHPPPGGSPGG